ncbi:Ycf66 family protein [Coleofasciculus sp. FACHB-129]|uniref:Ycf66 family protein n=1 Tax=Cyanophyceae TaxID=3028117 RepID=UPI0016889C23|nr:Ycf66 family protein [Coleofasciculus sp. FACHB-129]MBD1894613.1 hypothetical protein [Coleofasciculus sp. FACHB-129]
MLAYILAIAVAVGSFALYMAAFFFPEVHRKSDFIWSGVGLFYALVLWVCAGRITGGVLLGQIASVALVGWLGWETLTLRRSLTPAAQQTEIPSPEALQEKLTNLSLPQRITGLFTNLKDKAQQTASKVTQSKPGTGTTQPGASKTTAPAPAATDTEKPRVTVLDNRTDEDEDETVLLNQPPVPSAPSKPESQTESQMEVISVPSEESVQDTDLDDLEPPASVEATTEETVITPETAPSSPSEVEANPEANPENVPEPVRPNPPDPELVEAALEDAEEKHIPASPPEPAHEETSDSVSGTEQANQPLENPPNPT